MVEVGVLKHENDRKNAEIPPVAFIDGRLMIKMVFYSKLAVLHATE